MRSNMVAVVAFLLLPLLASAQTYQLTPTDSPKVPYPAPPAAVGSSAPVTCPIITHTLSVGSTDAVSGGDVTELQSFMISGGYMQGSATGYFGPITENAVKTYQAANGIVSYGTPQTTGYGYVGPKTRSSLSLSCGTPPTASQSSGAPSSNPAPSPASCSSFINYDPNDPLSFLNLGSSSYCSGLAGTSQTPSTSGGSGTQASTVVPQTLSVYPAEIKTAFRNPGMGWVAYTFEPIVPGTANSSASSGVTGIKLNNTDLASEIYTIYFTMGDLNPSQGAYRFDFIDRLILKAQEKNQKVHISIVTSSPNSIPNAGFTGYGITPTWFFAAHPDPVKYTTAGTCHTDWYGIALNERSAPCFWEPHYWHSDFLKMHKDFFTALGNRYKSTSAAGYSGAPDWKKSLAGIEISTYGFWGEWHSPLSFGSNDKGATLQRMIDDHFAAFATAPRQFKFSISSPLSANNYTTGYPTPGNANDPARIAYAVSKGAGIIRKFIGQYSDPDLNGLPPYAETNKFFSAIDKQYVLTAVKSVPLQGEWGSFDGTFPFKDIDAGNVITGTLETGIKQALALHASELGFYVPELRTMRESTTGETLEDYFQKRAGYRFVAREIQYPSVVSPGSSLKLSIKWSQLGVAKLYKQYYLMAYLYKNGTPVTSLAVDQQNWVTFDAHTWPLGPQDNKWTNTVFTVPASVAAGTYELRFAVVDDTGNPAMNLAIEGKDETDPTKYGRYKIGSITVK